jgi:hypothetical protein
MDSEKNSFESLEPEETELNLFEMPILVIGTKTQSDKAF